MKFLRTVCLSVGSMIVLCAMNVSGVESDDTMRLRWKPFKEARYFRRVFKQRIGPEGEINRQPQWQGILMLRYKDYNPEKSWQIYSFTKLTSGQQVPTFEASTFNSEISAVGNPYLFGMDSTERKTEPSAFRTMQFIRAPHWVPLFQEKRELSEGDRWEMKVPPIAYSPAQMQEPLKPHVLLSQEWTDTVVVDGYECAKIEYSVHDTGSADMPGKGIVKSKFKLDGVVYFAIEEGIPVFEKCRYSQGSVGETERVRWHKYMVLVCRKPFTLDNRPPLPDPHYDYRPPAKLGEPPKEKGKRQPGGKQPKLVPVPED